METAFRGAPIIARVNADFPVLGLPMRAHRSDES
jgi:hypothetical protein